MFAFDKRQQGILHLTWIAFFLTFVAWFNMAPFNTTLMKTLGLSTPQIKTLMICNVAFTVPSRIFIGALVDRFGPRRVYTFLLIFAAIICFQFALAGSFEALLINRLLMGIVGAGFVVGIKMIAEWFPPERMGTAQGLYGGWGNFGAAAAAFSLPAIAFPFPEEIGWRIAVALSGVLCLIWARIYFRQAEDAPEAKIPSRTNSDFQLEVTQKKDLFLLIILNLIIYLTLAAIVWKLSGNPVPFFPPTVSLFCYVILGSLLAIQFGRIVKFNLPRLAEPIPNERRYEFRQIFILSLVYSLTFGSELAVISMFPEYLETMFGLTVTQAGLLGSSFAFMNLVTRPSGGWISDCIGRKRSLVILLAGSVISYALMSGIDADWSLAGAVALCVLCSIFLQAGNGSVFSMVPLIRRDLTGKMAGLAGAFGNVGSVVFLVLFSFVGPRQFFLILSGYALLVLCAVFSLRSFKEVHFSFREGDTSGSKLPAS